MKFELKNLEETLPRRCCSFCTHLSLQGPNKDSQYNIKCIILNDLPKLSSYCNYFEPEHSDLNVDDLNNMYLNFLDSCLKVDYNEYLKSIHWKLFKKKALSEYNNKCSICKSDTDVDVYHLNRNLGRESLNDVLVTCKNCYKG